VRCDGTPAESVASRSVAWEIPAGIQPAHNWIAADCRLLSVSNTRFLEQLDLAWQEVPVQENAPAARFAGLSSQQLMQFARRGKGSFRYLPTVDPLGFLLVAADGSEPFHEPAWHVPTIGDNLLSVRVSGVAGKDGRHLGLGVVASEGNPRKGMPSEWKGTARVPAVDGCILIDIPTADEQPGGTLHRVMLMIVLQPFRWENTQLVARLPWNRARLITVKDREIRSAWMAPQDLKQRLSEERSGR